MTFVLVHGAWHGGWKWREVAPLLRAAGHEVFAPSLTGLGDRAHLARPDIDLELHIRDLVSLLEVDALLPRSSTCHATAYPTRDEGPDASRPLRVHPLGILTPLRRLLRYRAMRSGRRGTTMLARGVIGGRRQHYPRGNGE